MPITAVVMAFTLAPQLAAVPQAAAAASDAQPSSTMPADPEAAAMAEAQATGQPVVVDAETTDTQMITAEPSGVFQASLASQPVREETNGQWTNLDPSLVRDADGSVHPVSTLGDMTLSDGGPAGSKIASYDGGGSSYEVDSPFALPTPTLEDHTATYASVLPGVDLVVDTNTSGFSYNWVIKTPAAAADPRVQSLTMPIQANGLDAVPSQGGTSYVDANGVRQFWAPTPLMWDSSGDVTPPTSQDAVDGGPSARDDVALVGAKQSDVSVTLTPDKSLLGSSSAQFPIVIDPPVVNVGSRSSWTSVWNIYPTKSFWDTDHSLGAGYEGYVDFKVVRSYFKFGTTAFEGKHILGAAMNVKQIWDASCSARSTQVYRTAAIGSTTTWNNQPARYALQGTNSSTVGCSGNSGMVGWDVTQGIGQVAGALETSATFQIRAADESDKIAWKQYDNAGANLNVTYVSTPNVPTGLSIMSPTATYKCGTSTSPTVIGSTSIRLAATVSSADGSKATLQGVFNRYAGSTTYSALVSGNVASGASPQVAWTTANGVVYRVTAQTRVVWTYNGVAGHLDSAATSSCYFKSDTTKPEAPGVTSSAFTECANPDTPNVCTTMGTTHVPGAVSLDSPSTDVTHYYWQLNGGPVQSVATTGGAAQAVNLIPDRVLNTLTTWASDGVNTSGTATWSFKVNLHDPNVQWGFETGDGTSNEINPGIANLAFAGVNVAAPARRGAQALLVAGGGKATTSDVTVSTSADFTVAAWVHLDADTSGTVLAAPTSGSDAFEIRYDSSTHSWSAGQPNATGMLPVSTSNGLAHVWTHVAATYVASTRVLTLYVDGQAAGSATYASASPANSGWWLGCGSSFGAATGCATARLDDVRLYNLALSAAEIPDAAYQPDPTTNLQAIGSAARWDMTDPDGSPTAADSDFGAALARTDAPTPSFGTSSDGTTTGVMFLSGSTTQHASIGRPVVDSNGSFTIAAKVKLTDATKSMTIAQQLGTSTAAWTLGYRAEGSGSGQWVFQRSASDAAGAAISEVRSAVVFDADADFTELVATYNAQTKQLEFFVNGIQFASEGTPPTDSVQNVSFTTPWMARGGFDVGNGTLDGAQAPFQGEVALVEAFAGPLDDLQPVLDYSNGM